MSTLDAPSPIRDACLAMTGPERIRQLETEGFVIIGDALSGADIAALKAEYETLPMRPSFFTD
ncbi:MAG TPA: hypothetical protein VMQ93_18600, partial [Novosphingobium sp.]|nr:hypothetical protein [Novosphingobium sp.]